MPVPKFGIVPILLENKEILALKLAAQSGRGIFLRCKMGSS